MHDFNPGTAPSGVFWVVQVPDDSVQIKDNTLTVNLQNVAVTDNFYFFGPGTVPATVSFSITYRGFGSPRQIQAKTDPLGAFHWQGSMSSAANSGTFSVAYDDASFSATGSIDSTGLFGEIGTESNGQLHRGKRFACGYRVERRKRWANRGCQSTIQLHPTAQTEVILFEAQ